MPKFFVVESAANMPSTCKGKYKRVAVIETDGTKPSRIDSRPSYVLRIVKTWEKCNVGNTEKCAFRIALAEANALCEQLNKDSK